MASLYGFSVDGPVLKGTSPSSRKFEGRIATDGSVSTQYLAYTIAGNARARQLTMSGENGCVWDLLPYVPIPAQIEPGGEWAIGKWEGNLARVGTVHGTAGLTSNARTLIVTRGADGTVMCGYSEPQWAARTPMKSCLIGAHTISMINYSNNTIELSRTGPNTLTGVSAGNVARSQLFLTRAQ